MQQQYKEIYQQTLHWVTEARHLIYQYLEKGSIKHQSKSHVNDLVTEVDQVVEQFFVDKINQLFPDHQIIGEEGMNHSQVRQSEYVWYIDPIDGTSNFVTQQRDFAISIALYHQGVGVFGIIDDVKQNECFHICSGIGCFHNDEPLQLKLQPTRLLDSILAISFHFTSTNGLQFGKQLIEIGPHIRGIRSYGAATFSLLRVALGQIQGYLVPHLSPWDIAAGQLLVKEAGGIVTDFSGKPLTLDQPTTLLAAHPSIHQELLAFIQKLPLYQKD
ncbi:myo-inositol-1(or 4)-monophosphatase [Seinonella peptonophila]|uniref:inositol-phosphate phosphatase n=1 Tax=Seinonella peptonophila TaxID=112248 RepID=A0A1M4TL39_9BACL|nr:inositol monophosphatase [Seinonella peptonophila]SHE45007.1 myo-inositol-1(or 4)-monophosphatase [Seinonella peptonophila]